MAKFTAKQFSKHGFIHLTNEDFSDDGTRFQIWMHEESGLKVSYARYTYENSFGKKETEYFISPREEYYAHGLIYNDVHNEPEYKASEKFNGCYDVDVEELVELLVARHEMFLRVKAAADAEELDMTAVNERALEEVCSIETLIDNVKRDFRWWEFDEYRMNHYADCMRGLERDVKQLSNVIVGNIDRRTKRELVNRVNEYGYVQSRLDNGSFYYKELVEAIANQS